MKRSIQFSKKNKAYKVVLQIIVINYSLYFTASQISHTNAAFNDVEQLHTAIEVGHWDTDQEEERVDKSSLTFIEKKGEYGYDPDSNELFAYILNDGDEDMTGPVKYEVYWVEKGNPKNGEVIAKGEIPPLEKGETFKLTATPAKDGKYKFRAYQRPGHPGNGYGMGMWSESIDYKAPVVEAATEEENAENLRSLEGESNEQDSSNGENKEDKAAIDTEQKDKQENNKTEQVDKQNTSTDEEPNEEKTETSEGSDGKSNSYQEDTKVKEEEASEEESKRESSNNTKKTEKGETSSDNQDDQEETDDKKDNQ